MNVLYFSLSRKPGEEPEAYGESTPTAREGFADFSGS